MENTCEEMGLIPSDQNKLLKIYMHICVHIYIYIIYKYVM